MAKSNFYEPTEFIADIIEAINKEVTGVEILMNMEAIMDKHEGNLSTKDESILGIVRCYIGLHGKSVFGAQRIVLLTDELVSWYVSAQEEEA